MHRVIRLLKGFTLLELIVVIIIIGILGAFAFTQYTRVIEKGRSAEARNNLGTLRKLQLAHYQENGSYSTSLPTETGLATSCNTNYYFSYSCATNGTCTADRCNSGGKAPNVAAADDYQLSLSIAGQWSGTNLP